MFKKRKRSITSITTLRLRGLECDGCVMLLGKKHHKLTFSQRFRIVCHMETTGRTPVFVEAMTRFTAANGAVMRVWSRMDSESVTREEVARDLMGKFATQLEKDRGYTGDELALAVLRMRDDITAVEVVDSNGNGVVLYGEW